MKIDAASSAAAEQAIRFTLSLARCDTSEAPGVRDGDKSSVGPTIMSG